MSSSKESSSTKYYVFWGIFALLLLHVIIIGKHNHYSATYQTSNKIEMSVMGAEVGMDSAEIVNALPQEFFTIEDSLVKTTQPFDLFDTQWDYALFDYSSPSRPIIVFKKCHDPQKEMNKLVIKLAAKYDIELKPRRRYTVLMIGNEEQRKIVGLKKTSNGLRLVGYIY